MRNAKNHALFSLSPFFLVTIPFLDMGRKRAAGKGIHSQEILFNHVPKILLFLRWWQCE